MACKQQQTWDKIRTEALILVNEEPMLASFFHSTILNHDSLRSALSFQLANKLASAVMPAIVLREVIETALAAQPDILDAAAAEAGKQFSAFDVDFCSAVFSGFAFLYFAAELVCEQLHSIAYSHYRNS